MKRILLFVFGVIISASCSDPVADSSGSIYGIVTDSETGEPVRMVSVILSPGNIATVTGSDGHYEFVGLSAGQYKLQVSATGYLSNTRQVTAVAGTEISCDLVIVPEKKIQGLTLSTDKLNFSTSYKELMFTLMNTGTFGDLEWNISGLSAPWLNVSPSSGTIPMGGSTSIKVTVDRDSMSDSDYGLTYFSINANGNSTILTVNVEKDDNESPDDGSGNGNQDQQLENPTSGLYAYYTFEDNCDNTVEGAVSGSPINNPEFVAGLQDTKALKLRSSSNNYMTVPEPMIDEVSYTVSFWVKGLSDGHIFHVEGAANSDMLTVSAGRLTYSQVMDDNTAFAHPTLDEGQFTHIAVTQKNRTAQLYVNGKYVDVKSHNYGTYYTVGKGVKFLLGGSVKPVSHRPDVIDGASMIIDNLRIYNKRALSADEIVQIYKFEK